MVKMYTNEDLPRRFLHPYEYNHAVKLTGFNWYDDCIQYTFTQTSLCIPACVIFSSLLQFPVTISPLLCLICVSWFFFFSFLLERLYTSHNGEKVSVGTSAKHPLPMGRLHEYKQSIHNDFFFFFFFFWSLLPQSAWYIKLNCSTLPV